MTDTNPDAAPAEPNGFAALGLRDELLASLAALGYEEPTPIQRETIEVLMEGHDVLGQAATGTGKTAAFALPIVNSIEPDDAPIPVALVLAPTRELAVQVSEAMHGYGRQQRVKVLAVYGGQPIGRQFGALDRGAHVVVGTPGRVLDHIRRGSLALDAIRTVVLDEADEMMDMGFADDLEEILDATPADRQTVLFSATMPPRIKSIASQHQRDPRHIAVKASDTEEGTVAPIDQLAYFVRRHHKASALGRILDVESPQAALVFCKTRNEVDQLTETMNGRNYRAESLHGGMDQNTRDRVVARLRDGTSELLIATDVAARGLDIDRLTHVVNYDVPSSPETYVHRIGRVGRAGREGTAITLAEPRQRRLLNNIERLTKKKITVGKVPSVADLRAKQIEQTTEAVSEAIADADDDELEAFDAVLTPLLESGADARTVALAAIKLVHEANGAVVDEPEIPPSAELERRERNKRDRNDRGGKFDRDKPRGDKRGRFGDDDRPQRASKNTDDTALLFIGAGRAANVRPGDLVGAVANESGLTGRQIGPIRITERFSVVGVPADQAERVIKAMSKATVRGRNVRVRRYTD